MLQQTRAILINQNLCEGCLIIVLDDGETVELILRNAEGNLFNLQIPMGYIDNSRNSDALKKLRDALIAVCNHYKIE